MSLISSNFFIFILVVFLFYFLSPKKWQWCVLLFASYVFYLFSGFAISLFLMFTTITTFYTGLILGNINQKQNTALLEGKTTLSKEQKKQLKLDSKKKKRLILAIALLLTFGILAFLKYFNFFIENIDSVFHMANINVQIPKINLLLPLGISFYTFQSAGYIIDIYRDKYKPDRNLAKFALFVSFFPQIVQGPIGRYDKLAIQLYSPHKFDYKQAKYGIQLIVWGLFKKVVIADRAAVLVNQVFGDFSQYVGLEIYIAVLLFCVQIYADFSGGIDIARGIAQTMGIKLSKNFERPYFARSISEFWQRWHITLGAWMRDYLFYPLCLSKPFVKLGELSRKIFGNIIGKILPVVIVTFIVFIVIGIWHGASWKYIAFGMYNGGLIALGLVFAPLLKNIERKFRIRTKSFGWRLFQTLRTFFLCSVARYFSRAASFKTSIAMMGTTVTVFNPEILVNGRLFELGLSKANFAVLGFSILILFFISILQEKGFNIRQKLSEQRIVIRWAIYFIFLFYILIFGNYGNGFDANSFIYMGF